MYRPVGEHQNLAGEWVPIIPVGSDDRAQAKRAAGFYRERGARNVEVVVFYDPARVLAECEAKRRIVERYQAVHDADMAEEDTVRGEVTCAAHDAMELTIRDLVSVYVDHPDYREEWKL
jgi:hypothetical protein